MIGTDYEGFMYLEGMYVPVPEDVDIGSKHGTHIQLDGGTMHRDNVMIEVCPDPVSSPETMVQRVKSLQEQAAAYMSIVMNTPVEIVMNPAVRFDEDMLGGENAAELGCDRDYIAARGDVVGRLPMSASRMGNVRCGGGHIHISYDRPSIRPAYAIHMADLVLGTLETTMGSQFERREYYGIEGLFRPKRYGKVRGVEYRTPSNLWLQDSECIRAMMTNAVSLEQVLNNEPVDTIMTVIQLYWETLKAEQVIVREKCDMAAEMIANVQSHFPNYDWVLSIKSVPGA